VPDGSRRAERATGAGTRLARDRSVAMAIAHAPRPRALDLLERATSPHHATAEADLFRILDDPTIVRYRRFLTSIYHFEAEVEHQLARCDGFPAAFLHGRLKTRELAADLLALDPVHYVGGVLARRFELARFGDLHDALAWLYVIERNTLHHRELFRALAPHLRGTLHNASRFLTQHATDVYQRWHELALFLERTVIASGELPRVIDAAALAFRAQHQWLTRAS